jgi:hypothetical protein
VRDIAAWEASCASVQAFSGARWISVSARAMRGSDRPRSQLGRPAPPFEEIFLWQIGLDELMAHRTEPQLQRMQTRYLHAHR